MDYTLSGATYEVEVKRTGTTLWSRQAVSSVPSAEVPGLEPGAKYSFRVRAVSPYGVPGQWAVVDGVLMASDVTPPATPQFRPEDVTVWFRVITVAWSGKGVSAGAAVDMPRDFDHVKVWQSDNPKMANKVEVGRLYSGFETWTTPDVMPADVPVFFALTAIDVAGNESPMSTVQSITPRANVNVEEIANHLDAAKVVIENAASIMMESGATLGSKLTQAERDIADAKKRLSDADKRLGQIGEVATARHVYRQPEPPPPDPLGIWFDTDNDNIPHVWIADE